MFQGQRAQPLPEPPKPGWIPSSSSWKCSEDVNLPSGPNTEVSGISVSLVRTSAFFNKYLSSFSAPAGSSEGRAESRGVSIKPGLRSGRRDRAASCQSSTPPAFPAHTFLVESSPGWKNGAFHKKKIWDFEDLGFIPSHSLAPQQQPLTLFPPWNFV